MKAYTDYPFLASDPREEVVREVELVSYDGDKYVTVRYEGQNYEIKAGYIYAREGKHGDVPTIDVRDLPVNSQPWMAASVQCV